MICFDFEEWLPDWLIFSKFVWMSIYFQANKRGSIQKDFSIDQNFNSC